MKVEKRDSWERDEEQKESWRLREVLHRVLTPMHTKWIQKKVL